MPPGELDLSLCVTSGQVFRWFRATDGRWVGADGDTWYKVEIQAAGDDSKSTDRFLVESNADAQDFSSLFRLGWSASAIRSEIGDRAPEIVPYMRSLPGLRVLCSSDPEETLYTFLCTANNNISRITQMVLKLAEYGEPLTEVDGRVLHRFPASERIASIPEIELRAKGFGYRGRTIPSVANQVLSKGGKAWLESLKRGTYEDAHSALTSLNGIGPKLADCIALFGLDFTESVPVDTHVWQAACRLYFPEWKDKAITASRYAAVGDALRERLGKLAGWGHQHLFYDNVLNWRQRR